MKLINQLLIIVFMALFYAVFNMKKRNDEKNEIFSKAQARAKQLNRKLIVLGSPTSASGKVFKRFTKIYGCGDVCIDMNGCEGCKNSISNKVEDVLHKFPSNKYVVFESGLLEVVDKEKLPYIVKEINRVAGGRKNIYGSHAIQNYKFFYNNFGRYVYEVVGEGSISRFVDKYPPHHDYKFENCK